MLMAENVIIIGPRVNFCRLAKLFYLSFEGLDLFLSLDKNKGSVEKYRKEVRHKT